MENHLLGEQWGTTIEARPGNPYGDIVAISIARDDAGNKLIDSTGLYVKGERTVLGNINPDWTMGITNEFSFKGIYFRALVDIRKGGQMYSATNMYGLGYSGNFVESLEGREEWYESERARIEAGQSPAQWEATGGFLADGVYQDGATVNGEDVSGQQNQTYINPKAFWSQFSRWGDELHEPHIYDAGFVKLREVFIGYQLPAKLVNKWHFQGLNIGIFARNLWVIHKNVPNIDPEAAYNNGNGQGLEYASYPVNRSIGINLGVRL